MTIGPDVDARRARPLPFIVAWAVLLLLGAVSFASAFAGLGVWAPMIQFSVAAIQAATVFILFMRLKGAPSLKWIFAASGFCWLLFLYALTMTDYADRQGWPPVSPPVMGSGSHSELPRQPP
jgi:cytochrome c oxidase subunit IV